MGIWVDISLAEVVDVGGLIMRLSNVRKKSSSANMPLLPIGFSFNPHIGCQKCYILN